MTKAQQRLHDVAEATVVRLMDRFNGRAWSMHGDLIAARHLQEAIRAVDEEEAAHQKLADVLESVK